MKTSNRQTETLDKLYLEWSQFTEARTAREIKLKESLAEAIFVLKSIIDDLPSNKDWLNPDIETHAWRVLAKGAQYANQP